MKILKSVILVLLCFNVLIGYSQQKTKKQLRIEKKVAKEKEIEKLINAKEFQFVARNSNSPSFRMIDLSIIPNYIRFKTDFIKSEMPFFGRGFSGLGYGGSDTGLKFEGVPENFTVKKNKKEYSVKTSVKGKQDNFDITLSVSFEGSATLTIISNNRESISYFGEISALEEEKK
ncbi:DUF4251 domain-containing protein [Flavobacterium seoulense]|uniref:DUF4251 domain-containing protein n=1 Tax=Flavobacterium seoulense TaxID=1492738 RepID=A0A066WQQ4_9FLAO|nr:DUF4251 domain-containing protein [Flavobacterium seoulense]KDN56171.1 hypothetical protein FEM21_07230 [Flavobacterium seoulense]